MFDPALKSPIFLLLLIFLSWPSLLRAGVLENDVQRIFAAGGMRANVQIQFRSSESNQVRFLCPKPGHYVFQINSTPNEKASTLYWGIHKLGFLFPHPRRQLSPLPSEVQFKCGKGWGFRPAFNKRGFHLHTQHPSEWVQGFFMSDLNIAHDTIRWHARNFQNLMQIQMLRGGEYNLSRALNHKTTLALLKGFQLQVGLGMSFASIQQKSFHLIKPWKVFFGGWAKKDLFNSLNWVNRYFPYVNFWTIELGTSEFTPSPYKSTLEWIAEANRLAKYYNKKLYIKIHTSTGQTDSKYGNYNFLPQYSAKDVGVLPHTTMFYGLDELTYPMYGRAGISDMRDFLKQQSEVRPTIYFPETSYFIALDIDIPLFLTSYLTTRSEDHNFIHSTKAEGVLTFTTGQELGYWLFDWTVALMSVENYLDRPLIGLALLGEDLSVWRKILSFQDLHFKGKQLIQQLSSSNLMDELPFFKPIHDRQLLHELREDRETLDFEIANLEAALAERPKLEDVKDPELKILLQVTWLRIEHALHIRQALIPPTRLKSESLDDFVSKGSYTSTSESIVALQKAVKIRREARELMRGLHTGYNRYPDSIVFRTGLNPTSYQYGYGWPAVNLHYWFREEEQVRDNVRNPFFMNIYNIWDILF